MNGTTAYPLGLHRWFFTDRACTDGNGTGYRSLNLHLAQDKTGSFCCHSGQCIDSQLVCDKVDNCPTAEDEEDCDIIYPHIPSPHYRPDEPPVEPVLTVNKTKVLLPLLINCSLSVVDLVNIDDTNGLLSIIFG